MPHFAKQKPLVYACSGCSNVAQLTNDLAVVLDREGIAEMSCIAGIGGKIKSLVKVAQSGRPVLALDGCPLNCVRQTLSTIDVIPTWHIEVTSFGYKKSRQQDCSLSTAYELLQYIQGELLPDNQVGLH
ncbi:putative zinc-binding protein [Rheinheimera texasensis]|uniref:putative zinc-binding protein n=1 Tax=Rheinheimera texasensis TaxID=306205 RepID=UPI0004E1BBBA|nr:putative zinc-binding protein [Rheinheimera texasensis]